MNYNDARPKPPGVPVLILLGVLLLMGCEKGEKQPAPAPSDPEMIMGKYGCLGCHTKDGSGFQGPSFKGLFGSKTALKSGDTVLVDDAYLRRSILDPQADQVVGYVDGLMPKFPITPEELDIIVAYIKTIK